MGRAFCAVSLQHNEKEIKGITSLQNVWSEYKVYLLLLKDIQGINGNYKMLPLLSAPYIIGFTEFYTPCESYYLLSVIHPVYNKMYISFMQKNGRENIRPSTLAVAGTLIPF